MRQPPHIQSSWQPPAYSLSNSFLFVPIPNQFHSIPFAWPQKMRPFTVYCALFSLVSIGLNCLFLIVTRLQRVERVQEVLIFLRTISIGYIFVAIALMTVAPQSITLSSTNIRIPHGLLSLNNAGLSSNFMNGLAAFGVGAFLFTALSFCLLFLYHYRKMAGQMSMVFAPKNVPVFLGVALVFCLVQAILLFYSKVDPNYLIERLSRSKKWDEIQTSLGLNPNGSLLLDIANGNGGGQQGGGGGGNAGNGGGGGGGQNGGGGGAAVGGQSSISGGYQAITGGSNYSALAAAIESRQFERGAFGASGAPEARLFEGIFGTDYSRNPLYFLANGVLMIALTIAWAVTIITAITVKCKLSGRQESMSDKSQQEMHTFTNVLMLAHLPTLLVAGAGINYVVCFVMGESNQPIQEFLGMFLLAPVPALFPLTCLLFLKEYRNAAWQIILCRIWTRNQRQQRAAAERKAQENIDEELASATRNKIRNKKMPNSSEAEMGNQQQSNNNQSSAQQKSTGTASTGGRSSKPDEMPGGRYVEAIDEAHRQARTLFGKK